MGAVSNDQTGGDPSKRSPDYIGNQSRPYTMEEFLENYAGQTRKQIINEMDNRSKTFLNSQQGGPAYRYVTNPRDGRIIDMRHMLIVGNKPGFVGNLVEIGQLFTDKSSAFSRQDFYSNAVGHQFYTQYSGLQMMIFPNSFTDMLNNFFYGPHRIIYQ